MTDDGNRPHPNPTRTTHLDTAWDDEPTYTDQHVIGDDAAPPEDEGPALPPPRSVAPPRVMGNPSVPAPPPAASGPPAGPASSPPAGPVQTMKGGDAFELTPVPRDEPKIPRAPRVPTPPVPNKSKQSVPPAPPKPATGMAPAPPKPTAQTTAAPQPPAPLHAVHPSAGQTAPPARPSAAPPVAPAQPPAAQPAPSAQQPAPVQPTPAAQASATAQPMPPSVDPSHVQPSALAPAASPQAPFELLPEASALPVSLGEHLGRRILLGGFALPSWVLSAVSVFAAAAVGGIAAAVVFGALSSRQADPTPPAASSAPTPTAASTADVPLVDLASAGDPAALKQLEAKPVNDRSVDETIALASGAALQRKAALGTLASDLARNPNLAEDPDVMKRLREATEDRELARDALRLMASLPGPTYVDVIYDVWIGTKGRTPTTQLAEALVFTKEVRQKASPALAVALDLRTAETCEQVKPVVARAVEHGDRRSLRLLGKLTLRYGCGPRKAKDCWECLRGEDMITDAINAARKRPAPKL